MTFQRRSLTPEEMRGLAGGFYEELQKPVPGLSTPSTDRYVHYGVGGWAVYNNKDRNNPERRPVAIYNCEEGARVADEHYHRNGTLPDSGYVRLPDGKSLSFGRLDNLSEQRLQKKKHQLYSID